MSRKFNSYLQVVPANSRHRRFNPSEVDPFRARRGTNRGVRRVAVSRRYLPGFDYAKGVRPEKSIAGGSLNSALRVLSEKAKEKGIPSGQVTVAAKFLRHLAALEKASNIDPSQKSMEHIACLIASELKGKKFFFTARHVSNKDIEYLLKFLLRRRALVGAGPKSLKVSNLTVNKAEAAKAVATASLSLGHRVILQKIIELFSRPKRRFSNMQQFVRAVCFAFRKELFVLDKKELMPNVALRIYRDVLVGNGIVVESLARINRGIPLHMGDWSSAAELYGQPQVRNPALSPSGVKPRDGAKTFVHDAHFNIPGQKNVSLAVIRVLRDKSPQDRAELFKEVSKIVGPHQRWGGRLLVESNVWSAYQSLLAKEWIG
jgi:hypothetical protein